MVKLTRRLVFNLLMWVLGLVFFYPFLWSIAGSFKTDTALFGQGASLWPGSTATFANFRKLFANFPVVDWLLNSLWIAVALTALVVFFAALGGYGFAKFHFRAKRALFNLILVSLAIPFGAILVPLYIEITHLHLDNNDLALILPFMAPGIGVFLMRQFIAGLSDEVIEAGRIDGASEFRIFRSLILPQLKPAAAALATLSFVGSWNNFLWPLVVLNGTNRFTLPIGIYTVLGASGGGSPVSYGEMLAIGSIASVPVVIAFFVLQRAFVSGFRLPQQ